jgi:hypothetical protein
MNEADLREIKAGKIVVKPGCDMKSPHELWSDPVEAEALKVRLDDLHRAKIRLADEVLVVTTSETAPEPKSPTPGRWASPCGSRTPKSTLTPDRPLRPADPRVHPCPVTQGGAGCSRGSCAPTGGAGRRGRRMPAGGVTGLSAAGAGAPGRFWYRPCSSRCSVTVRGVRGEPRSDRRGCAERLL